ncbi:sulfite exporter TauE/SafE family protein [Alphaproteobacteria bacterium]|nr:sulfite exporter TauE/SafE family protein [Alphaproteobacteria bacterium]
MFEMPVELSEFTIYFLIIASMVTSFISSAFGIGGGAVLIGLLALKLPPFALLPIHGIVQIGSNFGRSLIFLKDIKRDVLIPFSIGTILGSLLGGTFFIQIEPWLLQLIVAIFILWSVFGKIPAIGATHVVFGGIFSGFFTMFFGASGTLVAGMVKTMKLAPVNHTATHSALMTIQHLIKVIIFGIVGFAYGEYFILITSMIISGFIGTLIGKKFLIKFGKKYFKLVLNFILTLIAFNLIWNALKMSGYLVNI